MFLRTVYTNYLECIYTNSLFLWFFIDRSSNLGAETTCYFRSLCFQFLPYEEYETRPCTALGNFLRFSTEGKMKLWNVLNVMREGLGNPELYDALLDKGYVNPQWLSDDWIPYGNPSEYGKQHIVFQNWSRFCLQINLLLGIMATY